MISLVVPAYNEEKLISDSIRSLQEQDYSGNYEIIVVDNGSTDNTAGVARSLGVKVITCCQKGVVYARQYGADHASGDIIVQADADTIYPRTWLRRVEKRLAACPNAVAVAGTFYYIRTPWWAFIEYFLRMFFNYLTLLIFRRPYIISGANFAFRKSAFIKIGGYQKNVYGADQFDIATRLRKQGKIIYDPWCYALTSDRSVQKRIDRLVLALMVNVFRFLRYWVGAKAVSMKMSLRSLPATPQKTQIKVIIPALLLVTAGVLCYGYFVPASPVFGKVYYRGTSTTADKVIALTFDDGPNEPYTSEVMDTLDQYQVKATFFLVGRNVSIYPDIAQRLLAEGHILGNHSYTHNANHALKLEGIEEIRQTQQEIFQATGVKPHLYRPPHGKKSPWEMVSIKDAGLIPVLWSDSTNELSGKSVEFLANEIVRKAKPGDIILMHDGYGTNHNDARSNKSLTVKMLPLVIEGLQARGYYFVTVPSLFKVPAYNQEP